VTSNKQERFSLTIALPVFKTDSNSILGVNKYAKGRTMKAVKTSVVHACRNLQPKKPLEKFHITAIRYGAKNLDDDNFHSLLKPYVDGLKAAKIIIDDSWKYLKPKDMTRDQVRGAPMIILTVTETI
jgi:homospermidine synthase